MEEAVTRAGTICSNFGCKERMEMDIVCLAVTRELLFCEEGAGEGDCLQD